MGNCGYVQLVTNVRVPFEFPRSKMRPFKRLRRSPYNVHLDGLAQISMANGAGPPVTNTRGPWQVNSPAHFAAISVSCYS
ncbi:hypothetical protein EVAR_13723_1 [Eumeta japonica]|uniref:Uncharacterized protein n=1 Tax=Eumeta variegata TaxID=151549 RepID=A0A4C1UCV7_EUMVA|nr:hypothetical protein EVAR_13723_1 [Eumeta japonica]